MGVGEVGNVRLNAEQVRVLLEVQLQSGQSVEAEKNNSAFSKKLTQAVEFGTQLNVEVDAPPSTTDRETQLKWAAQQLETLFMQELLSGMRRTVPEGGLFTQSFSTKTYQEMLDAEQAKALAQGGGIGLGEVILRQLRG